METPQLEPLLNTEEAARILRYSRRTLEALRVKGGGPAYVKLRGRALYRREDLLAFIAGNVRTSTSDEPRAAAGGA